jgi:type IV pilus assembly protein PilO
MKRVVLLVAAGVAVLVVIVWYAAIYSPKNSDLSKAQDDLKTAQSQRDNLQTQLSNLRDLEANRAKQQAALQKLNAAVPTTPDLAGFILQANDIATQAGVDWLQVSPSLPSASAGGGPTTINLTMQLQGGFFQVYDYLNRLEDLQRIVVVDTVNLTATGDTSNPSDPTLSMGITGRMFTRSAPVTPGGASGAPSGGGTTSTTPTTSSSSPQTTSNTRVG